MRLIVILLASTILVSSADSQQTVTQVQIPTANDPNQLVLPSNTEINLSLNEDLTTKGRQFEVGETFGLSVTNDVLIQGLVVIPRGARGVGAITAKTGKGMLGKSGKMEIEIRYVEVNGQRIAVEGKYRSDGEGNTVATVATVVVAAPVFGLLVTGRSGVIPRGREFLVRTKEPVIFRTTPSYGPPMANYWPSVPPTASISSPSAPVAVAPPNSTVINIGPGGGGPPRRPARTQSGFCYDVPRGYVGAGSLIKPAITTATPACYQLLEN